MARAYPISVSKDIDDRCVIFRQNLPSRVFNKLGTLLLKSRRPHSGHKILKSAWGLAVGSSSVELFTVAQKLRIIHLSDYLRF